jgi:hypothetical protein
MAVNWGQMAKSLFEGQTWDESVAIWKVSNVLGWSMSSIVGWYMCNYGMIKTQIMLGFERKINMLYKYEWYYTQPTKVLVDGEGKIDLAKTKKVTPNLEWRTLFTATESATHDQTAAEKTLKSANATETVAGGKTESYGTHTMNVIVGGSTETITTGKKVITAMAQPIQLNAPAQGIDLIGGATSAISITGASVTVSGPVINLG